MNTERLYEFVILSQSLNYSKAAETLFISQSVLSKHIKELEKELDLQLFTRNTHSVVLTPAGQLLAKEAMPLIRKCNSSLNALRIRNSATSGTIRIGCSLEFSYASHIQIFISRFIQEYPDIAVNTSVLSDGVTPESLLEYDILFAPCEFMNLPDYIHKTLIRNHDTYAAVYPGHRLLSKARITLGEMSGETLIVPFIDELFGPYAQNWNLVKKITHDTVVCTPVPNLPSAIFQVSIGQGIAVVPRYAKNMSGHNLFFIRISNEDCCFREYIYYTEHKENDAAGLFYQEFSSACLNGKNMEPAI